MKFEVGVEVVTDGTLRNPLWSAIMDIVCLLWWVFAYNYTGGADYALVLGTVSATLLVTNLWDYVKYRLLLKHGRDIIGK